MLGSTKLHVRFFNILKDVYAKFFDKNSERILSLVNFMLRRVRKSTCICFNVKEIFIDVNLENLSLYHN